METCRLRALPRLQNLVSGSGLRLLTATLDDPHGYGRIVRDKSGRILRIVEEKDASAREKKIGEINTGLLCAPTDMLRLWLSKLDDRNAQKEYYLTDIVRLAIASGTEVTATQPSDDWEILGVNSKDQLAYLERVHQLQNARELMARGATLADPWRFDVRGDIECGRDVFIDVNCLFEGKVRLADNVRIGAGCVLRNVDIGPDSQIAPYSPSRRRRGRRKLQDRTLCAFASGYAAGRPRARGQLRRDQGVGTGRRIQGQSPELSRRHDDRQRGQHRCGHHHLQL